MQAENYRTGFAARTGQCWGAACPLRAVSAPSGGIFNGRRELMCCRTALTCHSEERSDVGISQYPAG